MNQILYTEEPKKSNPIDKKKILLIFAIAIAIFGIAVIVMASTKLVKNKSNEKTNVKKEENITPEPIITLSQNDDAKAIINIESEIALSNIIYNWNDESPKTIEETGKTNVEERIDIPVGENTLYVSVIDSNGTETKQQKTYVLDSSKPVIEIESVVGEQYVKIKVTSKTELEYVSYKWNSDSETKEDMYTYENKLSYEKLVEIPIGQNTLKIEAQDINGNKTEKSKVIKGFPKAETTVTQKGGFLEFTVTGIDEIQKVMFKLNNGNEYTLNKETFGQTKTVKYRVQMVEGWNYLEITSLTVNNAEKKTYWKYEYNTNN